MPSQSLSQQKSAFLSRQIRLLSNPLQAPLSQDIALPDKVIKDVIAKANEKITQHNKQVFSKPTQRHVVEQIETLYWNDAQAEIDAGVLEDGSTTVNRTKDLSESRGVEGLPDTWDDVVLDDQEFREEDAEQYTELRVQLVELVKRKDEAAQRLARYQHLENMLVPFEKAQENIQPNLVTKDGEMARELDRLRVLLARVGNRMAAHNETKVSDISEERTEETFEDKMSKVAAWTGTSAGS